ncbi:NlpC/P60 family protein [Streptomyces sp. NPDC004561]
MAPENRDEVQQRINSLYDQAENATGNFNATRAMAAQKRSRGVPLAKRSGRRPDPALDAMTQQWFEAARAKMGPLVPAVLPADRQPNPSAGSARSRGRSGGGLPEREWDPAALGLPALERSTGRAVAELPPGQSSTAAGLALPAPDGARPALPGPRRPELPGGSPALPGAQDNRSLTGRTAPEPEPAQSGSGTQDSSAGLGWSAVPSTGGVEPAGLGWEPTPGADGFAWATEPGRRTAEATGLGWATAPGAGGVEARGLGGAEALGLGVPEQLSPVGPAMPGFGGAEPAGLSAPGAFGLGAVEQVSAAGTATPGLGTAEPLGLVGPVPPGLGLAAPVGLGPVETAVLPVAAAPSGLGDSVQEPRLLPTAAPGRPSPGAAKADIRRKLGTARDLLTWRTAQFPTAVTTAQSAPAMPARSGAATRAPLLGAGRMAQLSAGIPGQPLPAQQDMTPSGQWQQPQWTTDTGSFTYPAPATPTTDTGPLTYPAPAAPLTDTGSFTYPAPDPAATPTYPASAPPVADTGSFPYPSAPAPLAESGPAPESPRAVRAAKAIAFARAQVGKPCVWGATGPDSYDCSSLTQAAWKAAGVTLPRAAHQQALAGAPVMPAGIEPGDLVLFFDDDRHVGLHVGGGLMIHAPGPGSTIREESIYGAGEAAIHRIIRPA